MLSHQFVETPCGLTYVVRAGMDFECVVVVRTLVLAPASLHSAQGLIALFFGECHAVYLAMMAYQLCKCGFPIAEENQLYAAFASALHPGDRIAPGKSPGK